MASARQPVAAGTGPDPRALAVLDGALSQPRRHKGLTAFQLREHAQGILKRVLVTRLAEHVERLEPGWYVVRSISTGGSHVVKGPPRWQYPWQLECECRNRPGWAYPLCIHVGAILVARWQHLGYAVTQAQDGRVLVARDAVDEGLPAKQYPGLQADNPNMEEPA